MNARARRGRAIVRIRWRDKHLGGITKRESEILRDTKLFRMLKEMFSDAPEWLVRKAVDLIENPNYEWWKAR